MNILYLHTHDSGRYTQPYGYQIPMPNLMNLAQEGILFRHAYSVAPTCSPSRAGLLTGTSPHSSGMLGLVHRGFQLNDYNKHIVHYLNSYGYETVLSGIQHVAPNSDAIGYKRILDDQDYHMRNTGKSTTFDSREFDISHAHEVAEYLKKKRDKPFFLSFGMFNTHRIFPKKNEDINANYVMPPFFNYDVKKTREDIAGYIMSAKVVDECIGIVLNALNKSGIGEDTLVIFTTDHGIPYPNAKCHLYDTGIGVSLIIKYPGNKRKGEALDSLISHIDIFPTICDLLGFEKPDWLEGKSLISILQGTKEEVNDDIFSEVTFHSAYEPMRCIRTKRYKLIKFFDYHNQFVPANWDTSLSKAFLLENGYLDNIREREMLFDLYLDPVERISVVNDPRYKEIYKELSKRLENWMKRTDDPLLKGKVEKPEGAIVNKLSCLSGNEDNFE